MKSRIPPSCMVASPSTCNPQLLPPVHATQRATAAQPSRLKELAAAVLARNSACNRRATPAETVMQLGTSENGQAVASDSASVERAVFGAQDNLKHTDAALHSALTQAAEGLPIALHELIEAFGAEGAADWAEGYIPHCRPEFLRAFAVAVSERLAREQMDLAKNAGVHECQKDQKPAAYDGPAAAACGPAIDGVSLSWSDRTHDEA